VARPVEATSRSSRLLVMDPEGDPIDLPYTERSGWEATASQLKSRGFGEWMSRKTAAGALRIWRLR
jgi:hypothetical protein